MGLEAAAAKRRLSRAGRFRSSDLTLASVLTVLVQLELGTQDIPGPRIAVLLTALVMTGALWWRRKQPLLALTLCMGAFLLQEAISGVLSNMVTPFITMLVAIYSATASGSRNGRWAAGAIGIFSTSVSVFFDEGGADASSLIYATLVGVAAWGAGMVVWQRDRHVTQLRGETERLARERDEAARRAVEEERARVARELHDIIAHSVSVMRIQAAAAEEVFDDKPERAREALHSIQVTGRQALTDMRRLLVLLRADEGEAPLSPQPAVEDLSTLVEQARRAGLPVTLTVNGDERPLPAVIQLSIYRIVQESLTNALKHAGPAEAKIGLDYRDREITVEVIDNGRGPTEGSGGHGLLGMRERVALVGGRLEAGAGPSGGFVIRACLPIDVEIQ